MRLGQLARKLSVSTNQIVEFLATKSVIIENNSNARIDDTHAEWVVLKFAPTKLDEIIKAAAVEEKEAVIETPDVPAVVEANEPANNVLPVEDTQGELPPAGEVKEESKDQQEKIAEEEKPEVIKAPKIELSGLKVLGKIDLPEPKKKEATEPATSEEVPAETRPVRERRNEPRKQGYQRESRPQQPRKNPIALQREREALEEKKRREEEQKRLKEQKAKHYFNKVKPMAPTKKAKMVEEQTEEMSALEEQPKTLWGRFMKWLNS